MKKQTKKSKIPDLSESPLIKKQLGINLMLAGWNQRSDEKNWNLETYPLSDSKTSFYTDYKKEQDNYYTSKVA